MSFAEAVGVWGESVDQPTYTYQLPRKLEIATEYIPTYHSHIPSAPLPVVSSFTKLSKMNH